MKKLKNTKSNVLYLFGLRIEFWGPFYKGTYISIDTTKIRYVFNISKFKYCGKSLVANLI